MTDACPYCHHDDCECDGGAESQEEATSGTSFQERWELTEGPR
jgi:hypothetical protein